MSLAFTLDCRPSRRVQSLLAAAHGCASAGVLGGALQLLLGGHRLAAAALLLLLLPVLWAWRRSHLALRCQAGRLSVDANGEAAWCASPPAAGQAQAQAPQAQVQALQAQARAPGLPPQALHPLRWHVFLGVVWLHAQAGAQPLHLLSGVDVAGDRQWRALKRWLRWLDRGA